MTINAYSNQLMYDPVKNIRIPVTVINFAHTIA